MPTASDLYFFVHGEELHDRPPILLLHGAGGTHLSWPPQIRRLNGQRVYALDLPGHGKSGGVGGQEISEYGKVVVKFIKSLRLKKVIVVGFSMGSAIAISLALHYQKRIAALALIGAGAKMRVNPSLLEMASDPATFDSAVNFLIANSYSASVDLRIIELANQQMADIRPTVLNGDLSACNSFDVMDQARKIKIPTLLICGSADRMTPPNRSEYLRDQIEDAKLHILDGAGHMAMIEQPDQVASLLANFANEIQP